MSSGTNHVLGEILYAIAYFILSLMIMVLIIWIFLLTQYIWENQKKIQRQMRTNGSYETLVCEKIVAMKSDIVKLRLMIVVIVFELLMCICLILNIIGYQMSIHSRIIKEIVGVCPALSVKLKYYFLNNANASLVLTLGLGGSLATLSLYLVKAFLNQSRKTNVIKYMTIFIIAQVAITAPLDLIGATSFIAAYLYAIFNTVNYILFLKGCLKLRKLLKWRSQDCNFTSNKANMEMIEYRYKRQMYLLLFFYGLVIITTNITLVVSDGVILPSLSTCNTTIFTLLSVESFRLYRYLRVVLQVCTALQFIAGTLWGIYTLILYTAVLFNTVKTRMKKPKYTRFHVEYPSNTLRQPFIKPVK